MQVDSLDNFLIFCNGPSLLLTTGCASGIKNLPWKMSNQRTTTHLKKVFTLVVIGWCFFNFILMNTHNN